MKTLKTVLFLAAAMVLLVAGSAAADGWGPPRGPAWGHAKYGRPPVYRCAPPRPVYVAPPVYYAPPPVVIERHYVVEPVRYVAPYPSGFFFGLAFADRRSGFSFGFAGR
jgi:hypothetical protein